MFVLVTLILDITLTMAEFGCLETELKFLLTFRFQFLTQHLTYEICYAKTINFISLKIISTKEITAYFQTSLLNMK